MFSHLTIVPYQFSIYKLSFNILFLAKANGKKNGKIFWTAFLIIRQKDFPLYRGGGRIKGKCSLNSQVAQEITKNVYNFKNLYWAGLTFILAFWVINANKTIHKQFSYIYNTRLYKFECITQNQPQL